MKQIIQIRSGFYLGFFGTILAIVFFCFLMYGCARLLSYEDEHEPWKQIRLDQEARYKAEYKSRIQSEKQLSATNSCVGCDFLTGWNLWKKTLIGVNLKGANLPKANLSDATLKGVNLSGATLTGAWMSDANVSGSNLAGANLSGALLFEANLTEVNLTRANLTNANLTFANLTEVNLTSANLTGAWLKQSYLTTITFCNTTMPDGTINNSGC